MEIRNRGRASGHEAIFGGWNNEGIYGVIMPQGFSHEVWAFAKEQALSVLRRKAVQNNPLITYSEIAEAIRTMWLAHGRPGRRQPLDASWHRRIRPSCTAA